MSQWTQIRLPHIAERIAAFSIPDHRHFLLVSYEGVHDITFAPQLVITSDDRYPEGEGIFNGKKITFNGETHSTLGLYGGDPILIDDDGHLLELEPPIDHMGLVHVRRTDGELVESLPYVDFSGDWQAATFSTDFRYILIGTPYEVTLYRRGS